MSPISAKSRPAALVWLAARSVAQPPSNNTSADTIRVAGTLMMVPPLAGPAGIADIEARSARNNNEESTKLWLRTAEAAQKQHNQLFPSSIRLTHMPLAKDAPVVPGDNRLRVGDWT